MKPSEVLTVHQKRSYKNFKHENVRVIEGVSLFFFFLSFRWSDNVPETWVVNLENQSDKFYRISRPKKTQRISPSALLLRSGCVIQNRKKPGFPFSFQGAQISSKLSARACVKFKTVKSHVKYSCYWFQISLALHPPRTTERLVVYCIC